MTHIRSSLRRRLAIGALALATSASALAIGRETAAANSFEDDASQSNSVLHYAVRFSPPNVIDVPPLQQEPGDFQPGDYVVFSDSLLDTNGKTVGTEAGSGLITRVDSAGAQVHYSLAVELPAGQLVADGLASADPKKHLAIIGGTGHYSAARGYLDLVENGDGTGSLTVTLRP